MTTGRAPVVPKPAAAMAANGPCPIPGHVNVDVQLVAAIIAVIDDEPVVRVVPDEGMARLPSAPFRPDLHPTLEEGLRAAVRGDTGLELGHVEQLQTVSLPTAGEAGANHAAHASNSGMPHTLSVGYLALAHGTDLCERERESWQSCYAFFPWEDWRHGKPRVLREEIEPRLTAWARVDDGGDGAQVPRRDRMRICFGENDHTWDEEKVVERFDLLSDAGIATTDMHASRSPRQTHNGTPPGAGAVHLTTDHKRSLASAMSRLRAKIKSRPLVFDLMPETFTLFELQRAVEAILGPHLHKQNFRRLVEHMGLVEPTDEIKSHTGGRPAKLFRFRQECLLERMQPGVRVRSARG